MIHHFKLFSKEECEQIINVYNDNLPPCGYSIISKIKPHCFQFPYNEKTKWIYDKIYHNFTDLTGIKYYEAKSQFSLLRYKNGIELDRHIHKILNPPYKKWVVALILNDDYQGGEHNYYLDGIKKTIPKELGMISYYDSSIEHEVTKITDGLRWALVSEFDTYIPNNKTKII